jgi:hypothetical protein
MQIGQAAATFTSQVFKWAGNLASDGQSMDSLNSLVQDVGGFGLRLRSLMSESEAYLPRSALTYHDRHTGLFQTTASRTALADLPALRGKLAQADQDLQQARAAGEEFQAQLARERKRSGELLAAKTSAEIAGAKAQAIGDIAVSNADQMHNKWELMAGKLEVGPTSVPGAVNRLLERVVQLEDLFAVQYRDGHIPPPLGNRESDPPEWQQALGLYLRGARAPAVDPRRPRGEAQPSAAHPLAAVATAATLQVHPAPRSGENPSPVTLDELASNEVVLGVFTQGVLEQLRLLGSVIPTILESTVGASELTSEQLQHLQEVVLPLRGGILPQGLTFAHAPGRRPVSPTNVGATGEALGDVVDADMPEELTVSKAEEEVLLQPSPAPSPKIQPATD